MTKKLTDQVKGKKQLIKIVREFAHEEGYEKIETEEILYDLENLDFSSFCHWFLVYDAIACHHGKLHPIAEAVGNLAGAMWQSVATDQSRERKK